MVAQPVGDASGGEVTNGGGQMRGSMGGGGVRCRGGRGRREQEKGLTHAGNFINKSLNSPEPKIINIF